MDDASPTPITVLLERGHETALKSAIIAVKRSRKRVLMHGDDVQWFRAHCYAIQILGSLCNSAELQYLKKELEVLKSVIKR